MIVDPNEKAWKECADNNLWVFDKLILSRKLGYNCGPVGVDVPKPGSYIVRPITNVLGLGLGTTKEYLTDSTDHLTPGYFWCEFFEGDHISVDYLHGKPVLSVQGFKRSDTYTRWDRWCRSEQYIELHPMIESLGQHVKHMNCEYIGGKLIEVHFRSNPDWQNGMTEFIPVWQGQSTTPPPGYSYIQYPDIHGRIGAFIK